MAKVARVIFDFMQVPPHAQARKFGYQWRDAQSWRLIIYVTLKIKVLFRHFRM